jgi:hypothetical protein
MKYPFKFLDSYQKEDADIFFGRSDEIDELYEMMFQTDMLLVYGASGTGKTSLIQCGLASKFQSHDWLAINVRKGLDINTSLDKALIDAAGKPATTDDLSWLDDLSSGPSEESQKKLTNLELYFKSIFRNFFRPIYLVFDQFEELFILGTKEEQDNFIKTVQTILQIKQPVKLIFSIREEYLGYLNEFEKVVPQLLRKKLRVEPMNVEKVRKVIEGVTSHKDTNVKIDVSKTKVIIEGVFNKIKGKEKTLTIQLPYLQVFLDKLYMDITHDETRTKEATFTTEALDAVGDIDDVLREFLEAQAKVISSSLHETFNTVTPETIWKILSPFATLEGTKEPIRKSDVSIKLPDIGEELLTQAVNAFVNKRILRYSQDTDTYEIAHDSLALHIAKRRTAEDIALLEVKRMITNQASVKESAREAFTEKQLDFIWPYLNEIRLSGEERKLIDQSFAELHAARRKRKFLRWTVGLTSAAVLVLTVLLSAWALNEQSRAVEALNKNKKEQAVSKASQFKAFGDSYMDLNKFNFARESYQAGLDTLKQYTDVPLYSELRKKLNQCNKKH